MSRALMVSVVLAGLGCSAPKPADPPPPPPAVCGDGTLTAPEACETGSDCGRRFSCTAACTCEALAKPPLATAQVLIDDAFRAGRIDLATSLLYRAYVMYGDPRLPEGYDGVGAEAEDPLLHFEIDAHLASFTARAQAQLKQFTVRPSDPKSVFSMGYLDPPENGQGLDAQDCNTVSPCAGWKSNDDAHFRVWSCGDAAATARAELLADAEAVYPAMTAYLGEPVPDTADNADPAVAKTDIYIVEENQARLRNGACAPLNEAAAAQAISAPQFLHAGGSGTLVSSGYLIFPTAQANDVGERRRLLVHEFFHVQQFAHSLRGTETWLGESTAVWAEQHFLESKRYAVYTKWFSNHVLYGFLSRASELSLDSTALRPVDTSAKLSSAAYDAFIWHLYAEQEQSPAFVADLWRSLFAKNRPANEAVDALLPFDPGFSKFMVRNLNRSAVKEAALKTYDVGNPFPFPSDAFPALEEVIDPLRVVAGVPALSRDVDLPPLAAQYLHVPVAADVQELTFDFSKVTGTELLDFELLLRNPMTGWKSTSLKGSRKLTLCRDTDPVAEVYIAVGNHDWRGGARAGGKYELTTKATCCPPGKTCWAGTAHVSNHVSTALGTLDMTSDATVSWAPNAMDPSGTLYSPTGSVTYSGRFVDLTGCVQTLAPVTYAIKPMHGTLYFLPNQQYLLLGSGVEGDGLHHWASCNAPAETLSDVKPWLQQGMQMSIMTPPGNLLEGTYVPGDGNVYTWRFEKQ